MKYFNKIAKASHNLYYSFESKKHRENFNVVLPFEKFQSFRHF